jgi:hypothetical protein
MIDRGANVVLLYVEIARLRPGKAGDGAILLWDERPRAVVGAGDLGYLRHSIARPCLLSEKERTHAATT